ncbi:MAG: hypothetical protein V4794_19525 [Pseudomonadota bacterium]
MSSTAKPGTCSPADMATWQAYLRAEEDRRWPPYMPLGSAIRAKRDERFQAFKSRLLGFSE